MDSRLADVTLWDCSECMSELLEEIRRATLPVPAGLRIFVPADWSERRCPHGRQGVLLDLQTPRADEALSDRALGGSDSADEDEGAPDGSFPIDATRNIGYSARECGRYGSHPAYDAFDDASDADGVGLETGLVGGVGH